MRVFIAEKPSLAEAIFKGLGGNPANKKNGYYEKGNDIVTWCLGHLLRTYDPEDFSEQFKKWTIGALPITSEYPTKFKPLNGKKKQLDVVIGLIKRADSVVHAGDPDPEGCLLVDELLMYTNFKKPVQRLLISDLNDGPVKKALASMRPNSEFANMTKKALARTIADKSFGYNLTRAYTLMAREKGADEILNIGRVISAVLGLINSRTLANQSHKKSYYYNLLGTFTLDGVSVKAKLVPDPSFELDDKNRLISSLEAAATKEADTGSNASVTDWDKSQEKRSAPMPYNLSKLQIDASKKWGYTAKKTLELAQKLYEHKLITYPRSDNQYLSDAIFENTSDVFEAIRNTAQDLSRLIDDADREIKHRSFNTSKVEAHHALVPTHKDGSEIKISEQERNIYELICRRYIALFYPDSIRQKISCQIECNNRSYKATQTVLDKQGWEVAIQNKESSNDDPGVDLEKLQKGMAGECQSVEVKKEETKPPKYFDEAGLLSAMTSAAKFIKDPELRKILESKDKGKQGENGSIGTEATRGGHLEKIASLSHLVVVEKEKGYKNPVFKTTVQGQEFCSLLPDEITMPDISATWESDLSKIESGQMTVESFLLNVDTYIQERVEYVKSEGVSISAPERITCPTCNKGSLTKRKGKNGFFWACNRFPDCKTVFPDAGGKPKLNVTKKKDGGTTSETEFCKSCGSALVRRETKTPGKYWWGCSAFPKCRERYFDKDGKPDRDRGNLNDE
ncbi:DNA topoisomerase (plasmid) [Vibrio nigripulchritudo]|uniref:DNA topoisomerase III n=1 Tax=Vibrio nigripulchritudo TaxID=28173 RepID=UPI00190A68AD|nr:DNA topoisomerase III [Vibrio nigripulchritudo]BCL74167.1 DNA topoisomerase [Vibrio nigripulchritudo]